MSYSRRGFLQSGRAGWQSAHPLRKFEAGSICQHSLLLYILRKAGTKLPHGTALPLLRQGPVPPHLSLTCFSTPGAPSSEVEPRSAAVLQACRLGAVQVQTWRRLHAGIMHRQTLLQTLSSTTPFCTSKRLGGLSAALHAGRGHSQSGLGAVQRFAATTDKAPTIEENLQPNCRKTAFTLSATRRRYNDAMLPKGPQRLAKISIWDRVGIHDTLRFVLLQPAT